jgi:hypothetical protein
VTAPRRTVHTIILVIIPIAADDEKANADYPNH